MKALSSIPNTIRKKERKRRGEGQGGEKRGRDERKQSGGEGRGEKRRGKERKRGRKKVLVEYMGITRSRFS